jgi:hypothetical protein
MGRRGLRRRLESGGCFSRRMVMRGGGSAPPPSLGLPAAAVQTSGERGEMKFRVSKGSDRVFIPPGTISGLFYTLGPAADSKEVEFIWPDCTYTRPKRNRRISDEI